MHLLQAGITPLDRCMRWYNERVNMSMRTLLAVLVLLAVLALAAWLFTRPAPAPVVVHDIEPLPAPRQSVETRAETLSTVATSSAASTSVTEKAQTVDSVANTNGSGSQLSDEQKLRILNSMH